MTKTKSLIEQVLRDRERCKAWRESEKGKAFFAKRNQRMREARAELNARKAGDK